MVERCLCKADVSGSSPLTSTKKIEIENVISLVNDVLELEIVVRFK